MPSLIYDTRFFVEYFFSTDNSLQVQTKHFVAKNKERYVSVATLHELYLLELARRGREIATLRLRGVLDLFRVVGVSLEIAISAAELRHKYRIPLGDSLIAATCQALEGQCVTDDPHFTKVKEIKTLWI
jgi:predicted nucleic acid-binding protein